MKLRSLNCSILPETDIRKLHSLNINTLEQLVSFSDLETLSRISGIELKTLKLAKKLIIGHYAPFPEFGNILFDRYLKKNFIIKTECPEIDEMISSGVYSSEITEISGASSTGKTQFCFNLIANMLDKYESFTCLYIDSNRSFCTKRLVQLLKCKLAKKLSNDMTIVTNKLDLLTKQIKVIDCQNVFNLLDILFTIKKVEANSSLEKESAISDELCPNLLIIDNLTSLFSQFKASNSIDLNYHLNYLLSRLKFLSCTLNMAIVLTTNNNDYTANYTYNSSTYSSTINFNCVYNSTWKSLPNLIIYLRNVAISSEESQSSFSSNTPKNQIVRKFEILKCIRPKFSENSKKFCYFKIEEFGFSSV